MILLLGGTADTAPLAQALAAAGHPVLVSTATEEPLRLEPHPRVRRRSGPLDEAGLEALVRAERVRAVLDATHPYAAAVRELAPRACRAAGVPYLSWLRPASLDGVPDVVHAADHEEAARLAFSWGKPVLLATGSRHLEPYAREARRTDIPWAARVLDSAASIEACRRVGLGDGRVVALRGPFTVEQNLEHLTRFGAGVLVTKDGGVAGGAPAKLEAARRAQCRLVLVGRPAPAEGAVESVEALLRRLAEVLTEPASGAAGPQAHGGNRVDVMRRFGLGRVVDFSASINPLGHPPGLRAHLDAYWDEAVLHYPDPHCTALREALAERAGLSAARVLAGNGSAELISLLLQATSAQRLVLAPPDFSLYRDLAPPSLPVAEVPRPEAGGFGIDADALAAAARPGDLVLFSNPGNPSGTLLPRAAVLDLGEALAARGALLAVDEAFADFCADQSVLDRAGDLPGLCVLRSLTKFYGIPGLRAGYLVGPEPLIEAAARRQLPWSVNGPAQEAARHCLGQSDWERASLAYVAEARAELAQGLAEFPGFRPLPSAANYLLVALAPPAPAAGELYEALARRGILVRHCGSFGLGERYVRVAVRTREENRRLLTALAEISGG